MSGAADSQGQQADGVLVVDKPVGPTSHDVVARARRLLRTRRIGHTGTLDPFASGVLPLVVGRATRLARFLSTGRKTYRAVLRLGVNTTTHDLTGTTEAPSATGRLPAREAIDAALAAFRGAIEQVPPAYSAKHVEGTRAYQLARQQRAALLAPVLVHVWRLDVEAFSGDQLVLSLDCGPGFYVRALARDLGAVLGCGAHLTALRRTRSGEFHDGDAATLEALEADANPAARLVPLAVLLTSMPTAFLDTPAAERVKHGNAIADAAVSTWAPPRGAGGTESRNEAADYVRLAALDGELIAVGRRVAGTPAVGPFLQPSIVLV